MPRRNLYLMLIILLKSKGRPFLQVGQRHQIDRVPNHRLSSHLWNGISTVRVNCGTALVGTPEQVANEILQYWLLGIDEFILSGFPHVEECERAIDQLIPLVRTLINRERSK